MKLIRSLVAATPLVVAFTLIGAPAANAQAARVLGPAYGGANEICETSYCVTPNVHGGIYVIESQDFYPNTASTVSYLNKYTTPNGNAWYEIKTRDGGCLNYDPGSLGAGNGSGFVYDDGCRPGDPYELWYTHVKGQFINLGGNEVSHHDTYLFFIDCVDNACALIASNTSPFAGWSE